MGFNQPFAAALFATNAPPLRQQHPGNIACVPELGAGRRELAAIPGLPPVVDNLPDGCAFAPRCDKAQESCRKGDIPLQGPMPRAVRCLFPEEAL